MTPGALDLDKMQVLLTVTTDASGVVREAEVAEQEQARIAADPRFRAFSERAMQRGAGPALRQPAAAANHARARSTC